MLPAYARLASGFTPRERNDFYLRPRRCTASSGWPGPPGLALGGFVVWAPFIPLWSKEWVLVFGLGGFVFPTIRRYFALRRYQHELNDLVARTDDEIWRLDLGFLTAAWERGSLAGGQVSEDLEADPAARPESAGGARGTASPT